MEKKEVKNKETKKNNNTSSKAKKNSSNKNKTSTIKDNKISTTKKKNNSKKSETVEVKNNNSNQKNKIEKELKTDKIKENNEIKKAKEKNEVKKEIETKITSKEINLVPKDNKLVKNEFTSTIDIKEIIKAIPKKKHKKEEVENAIADIFDVEYNSSKKEKNKKIENLLEKTQDISIIREEIKKTETSTKEINKNDEYIIDEINPILTSDNSIGDLKIDSLTNNEFEPNKKNIWKIISVILTILLISTIIFIIHHFNTAQHDIIVKENKILDDNYVFVGDSITELYKLDDYYSNFKVVNSGKSGYKTTDILNNIDTMVYDYNPTKIFLLIGTNDFLDEDVNSDEVYENIIKIIKNIQKNRKYAKIYVESIYPTCHHDNEKVNLTETNKRPNKELKKINKKLEDYCQKNNITYIDVYSKLIDEEGELNLDYTVDGLHLSKEGYDVVSKTLMPYVKEKIKY